MKDCSGSDFPEAMPIFNQRTSVRDYEPEVKYRLNRAKKQMKASEELNSAENGLQMGRRNMNQQQICCKHSKLKDYYCEECQQRIPEFRNLFDTDNILTFLNIRYVSECGGGEDDGTSFLEQAQHQKMKKSGQYSEAVMSRFGKIGEPKNLSTELKSYIYQKRNRELQVLGCGSSETDQIDTTNNNNQDQNLAENPANNRNSNLNSGIDNANQQTAIQSSTSNLTAGFGPHCLLFDSLFESGNLERAEYVSVREYNLYLNVDTNTKGHQQWFYFQIKNTLKDTKYTFNIRNFTKPFSLHRQGMQIMQKSKKKQLEEEETTSEGDQNVKGNQNTFNQWVPVGEGVSYWRTDVQREGWRVPGPLNMDDEEDDDQVLDDIPEGVGIDDSAGGKNNKQKQFQQQNMSPGGGGSPGKKKKRYFYCLTFTVELDYDDDTVCFAYSTPCPYTQIMTSLIQKEQTMIEQQSTQQQQQQLEDKTVKVPDLLEDRYIESKNFIYERKTLCRTITGLPVPYITLTARKNQGTEYKRRQVICVSARVHPGETNSNFVMDGLIDFLLTQEGIFQLLQHFIFKLIPCLNPDGNICGNYRSSVAGVDLNRQWVIPSKELHPTIYHTKELLSNISKERQLLIYCDLHCHSKKKNSFIYGCNTAANGGFTSWTKVRLLPRILAKLTPLFNIKDCRFRVDQNKQGTARVIVWKEFGVTNSFTLENSFYGYELGKKTEVFTIESYQQIGKNLALAFSEYRILNKQIEKEIQLSNGWLKPKLLLEVTGVPAAQRLANEIAMKLKEEKKRKQIAQYRQNLGLADYDSSSEQVPAPVDILVSSLSPDKTRNLQRACTTISDSKGSNKVVYKKQISNQSDKLKPIERHLKKESSSESTKVDTIRKLTMVSNDDLKINDGSGAGGSSIVLGGNSKIMIKNQNNADIAANNNNKDNKEGQNQLEQDESPHINLDNINNTKNEKLKQLQRYVRKFLTQKKQQKQQKQKMRKASQDIGNQQNESPQEKFKRINYQLDQDSHQLGSRGSLKKRSKSLIADWRCYFENTELDQVFNIIAKGEDPEEEENASASDCQASEDNFDLEELYKEIYLRESSMEREISQKNKAELQFFQELKVLLEENQVTQSLNNPDNQQNSPEIKLRLNRGESSDGRKGRQIHLSNNMSIVSASFNFSKTTSPDQQTSPSLNKSPDSNNQKKDVSSYMNIHQGGPFSEQKSLIQLYKTRIDYSGKDRDQNGFKNNQPQFEQMIMMGAAGGGQSSSSSSSRRPYSQFQDNRGATTAYTNNNAYETARDSR